MNGDTCSQKLRLRRLMQRSTAREELMNVEAVDPMASTGQQVDSAGVNAGGPVAASEPEQTDAMVDEWGRQSFPASDPPSNW
jgi:hypothetical protein